MSKVIQRGKFNADKTHFVCFESMITKGNEITD